jgi:hypothetical protein
MKMDWAIPGIKFDNPKRKPISKKMRQLVKEKCNGNCACCGEALSDRFCVDHIQAFYRGGECSLDNYLPACFPCNSYKLTSSIEEFRRHIARQLELAFRNSVNYRTAVRFGLTKETNNPVIFYFETLNVVK